MSDCSGNGWDGPGTDEHDSLACERLAGQSPDEPRRSLLIKTYYELKPLLPRAAQLALRRWRVRYQRRINSRAWPIDPASATPPADWQGWPDGKSFAVVLTHDVELGEGQAKCLELAEIEMGLGFRSAFYFVPLRYEDKPAVRRGLAAMGCEVGVHGLYHDGKLYRSHEVFSQRARAINCFLKQWGARGFRSPSMHHNLEWLHELNVAYDASTFDTDPFEPQPDGVGTIFPFVVHNRETNHSYVELPYTLPQDYTLYALLQERGPVTWKAKLDWVALHGGMALLITHPDYMRFGSQDGQLACYPADFYREFLRYIRDRYEGQYWQALPSEVADYVRTIRPAGLLANSAALDATGLEAGL